MGADQKGGGSHSLIFRDCGRAVSRCSCNKRSVLENNQCAAILTYWLVHSCSWWRFMALLHLTHLAARTAIAPDNVQWIITASAIILLLKKKCCQVSRLQCLCSSCCLCVSSDKLQSGKTNSQDQNGIYVFMSMKTHFYEMKYTELSYNTVVPSKATETTIVQKN